MLVAGFNLAELSAFAGMLEEARTEIEATLQLTRERGDRLWDSWRWSSRP
jgi:hypothetical protein